MTSALPRLPPITPSRESSDLRLHLPDGSEASFDGRELAIHDADGQLVARYVDGQLVIGAGNGRVRLAAAEIEIEAGASLRVAAPRLELAVTETSAAIGRATVVAREIETTARRVLADVERYELRATRLYESVKDAFREVEDLAQTRAGRLRTLVKGVHTLFSERNVMVSEKETKVDGSRILLG
jgi:hypothetical protein